MRSRDTAPGSKLPSSPRLAESDAIDLALENGQWKGLGVYIFASGPTDVARWVDDEEEEFTGRERGLLWIHRAP